MSQGRQQVVLSLSPAWSAELDRLAGLMGQNRSAYVRSLLREQLVQEQVFQAQERDPGGAVVVRDSELNYRVFAAPHEFTLERLTDHHPLKPSGHLDQGAMIIHGNVVTVRPSGERYLFIAWASATANDMVWLRDKAKLAVTLILAGQAIEPGEVGGE